MRKKMISAVFIGALASSSLLCAEGAPADTMVYSQAGEITDRSAILWARCNSEQTSRLIFRIFRNGDHDYDGETHDDDDDDRNDEHRRHRTIKRIVNADSDYTASVKVSGLRDNTRYYYQASCQPRFGRDKRNAMLGPVSSFTTAAETDEADEVSFVWMADLAGQGWGRNPELLIMDAGGETI